MQGIEKLGEIVGNEIHTIGKGRIAFPDFSEIRFKIIRHNQNGAHTTGFRHDEIAAFDGLMPQAL